MLERLSKIIAFAGAASRREADELVRAGRITVNGTVIVAPGHRVDVDEDHIKLDGKLLRKPGAPIHLILNKPRGVLSVTSDPEGRPTVVSKLKGVKGRVVPVGRLEADDEGLLLLTSDGSLAYVLDDPRAGVPRTYLVKVRGIPDENTLTRLASGVSLQRGGKTLPIEVRRISQTRNNAWIQVTLQETRPHLLRRMLMKLRHPALKVKRLTFGPLSVKGLAPGTFRKLSDDELEALRSLASDPPGLPKPGDLPPAPIDKRHFRKPGARGRGLRAGGRRRVRGARKNSSRRRTRS